MDFDDNNKQISKYNDAFNSISRLHDNWLRCYRYIRTGKFPSWKVELDIIWLELYPDIIRQQNKDELLKSNLEHIKQIAEAKNKEQTYYYLNKRQEFLRGLQDVAGKAGVYVDENEELFE